MKELAYLKELGEKATPGEWRAAHNPYCDFDGSFACIGPFPRMLPAPRNLMDLAKHPQAYALPVCAVPNAFPLAEKDDPLVDEQRVNAAYIAATNPPTILELIARIERVEAEADWLAKNCQGENQCPYFAFYRDSSENIRPQWCDCLDNGEEFDCDGYAPDCWREAARNAMKDDTNA